MPEKTRGRLSSVIGCSCVRVGYEKDLLAEAGLSGDGLSRGLTRAGSRPARGASASCCGSRDALTAQYPGTGKRASTLGGMAVTGAPELLIVMGGHATPDQIDDVVARLEEAGCAALVT